MPSIKKVTKKDIIACCIDIIKSEGIAGINARSVAKKLNCSTQPIYYLYANIDEMKNDVMGEIFKIFKQSMMKKHNNMLDYKDIGINFINFASKEPILFNLLFKNSMQNEIKDFLNLTGEYEDIYDLIYCQTGLSRENAQNFHMRMWLYVNGIASFISNNNYTFSQKEIGKLLKDQYTSMIMLEMKNGNVDKKVLNTLLKNNLKQSKDNDK